MRFFWYAVYRSVFFFDLYGSVERNKYNDEIIWSIAWGHFRSPLQSCTHCNKRQQLQAMTVSSKSCWKASLLWIFFFSHIDPNKPHTENASVTTIGQTMVFDQEIIIYNFFYNKYLYWIFSIDNLIIKMKQKMFRTKHRPKRKESFHCYTPLFSSVNWNWIDHDDND